MEYKILNEKNKSLMRNEMNNDLNFKWEDDYLLDDIIRKYKTMYHYDTDPEEYRNDDTYLNKINNLFNSLFKRKIKKEKFLNELKIIFSEILNKFPSLGYQYRYDIKKYEDIIKISNRLIISGSGGIGKSYFIYKLEEKMSEYNIPHICIYGKFNDNIPQLVFNEVLSIKHDFYFVIDALNEFEKNEQLSIIKELKRLSINKNINIIVTYRTASLEKNIIEELEDLLINRHEFRGVEFESSLLKMIETYGMDSVKFLDIIESNNPSQLKMLNKILFDNKLTKQEIGNLVQITFIYEKFIKGTCGLNNWKYIKNIGKFMLDNETQYIEDNDLKNILKQDYQQFIDITMQNNFIESYESDGKLKHFFTTQHIADYIIARPLFNEINNKSEEDIIKLIDKKTEKLYSIKEAIIILLFDKFKKSDLRIAFRIILKSNLKDVFNDNLYDILKKESFNNEQISLIQKLIKIKDFKVAFMTLGGYPNKPFNCTNYLNDIFFKHPEFQKDLLVRFSESEYLLHLKNIIYTLPFLDNNNDNLEEYFNYSFWLTSVPNVRIRNLAIKLLYDVSCKNGIFEKKLINFYKKTEEQYIKKALIHVLTSLPRNKRITKFIKSVYYDFNEINAEIVQRTSNYLKFSNNYQLLNKNNVNKSIPINIKVDKKANVQHYIFISDIYEKYLLKFEKYGEENTLSLGYYNFISNDNLEIFKYNKELINTFKCVKNGYCKYSIGSGGFDKFLPKLNLIEFDKKRMFILFQEIFKKMCCIYNYDYLRDERFDEHLNKFTDSTLRKILLLSQEILLGSLMTNYYTNEFSVYNDDIVFGYKNYSYIDVTEEDVHLTSPVSLYNEVVDKLNFQLCNRIGLYDKKDYKWYKAIRKSINNCVELTKPIVINGESWSLICGRFNLYTNNVSEHYSCFLSINSIRMLIGDDDSRYMTIENEEYIGNVNDYYKMNYDKNMDIPNFQSNSVDIKDTNTSFPPPEIVRILDLKYDFKTSSWIDNNGNIIILCDNNVKYYYKYPVSNSVYIKTSILNKLKLNNKILYWCYTEKRNEKHGWNDKACLHIEIDSDGKVISKFQNNSLKTSKNKINNKCENCKFGIYQKSQLISKDYNYNKLIDIINDLEY